MKSSRKYKSVTGNTKYPKMRKSKMPTNRPDSWKNIIVIIGFFATIIMLFFGIRTMINDEVNRIISSPEVIEQLTMRIRPFLIFDENESIIIDEGAMNYIEDIKVEIGSTQLGPDIQVPIKIIIVPKSILSNAPQIQCMDPGDEYSITVSRGKKYSWEYELSLMSCMTPKRVNKFRIDIIP